MEKNHLLASLALAGSMLAASPTEGQESAGNAASRTNKALIELLNELPAGFDKAWEVIQWDVILTKDGDLSDSDKAAIEDHMWKLATTVVAEKAKKVMEAMNEAETILAADLQIENKVPIGEDREAKKNRELNEKIFENMNDFFNDPRNITYNISNSAPVDTKSIWGERIFIVKEPRSNLIKNGEIPKATANFNYWVDTTLIPKWGTKIKYVVSKLSKNEEGVDADVIELVRIAFYDSQNKRLNMDWTIDNTGSFCLFVDAGEEEVFLMPPGATRIEEKIDLPLKFDDEKNNFLTSRYRLGRTELSFVD